MSGPYFRKQTWPPFHYQGIAYNLSHLDDYQIQVKDSAKVDRRIAITFRDHCFTRKLASGDDPALIYPASTRNPGVFCPDRYHHSLQIRGHIAQAVARKVWNLGHEAYAIVPTVDHQGNKTLYGILFSHDRVTGLPVDLNLRVRSAHVRDQNEIITYGAIDFSHLVRLRMDGRHPNRITDRHRKKPRPT